MAYVALVTLLIVIQIIFFMFAVGKARVKSGIDAPTMVGDEQLERANRVHMNTIEQVVIALPAMWVCGYFYNPMIAAALGFAFVIGRAIYAKAYMKDPSKRSAGMMVGFLAYTIMVVTGLWFAIVDIVTSL